MLVIFLLILSVHGIKCSLLDVMQRTAPKAATPGVRDYSFNPTSCSILGQPNYDTNYNNESICILVTSNYVNEFEATPTSTGEIICPFPNMYIANITSAMFASMSVPRPNKCVGDIVIPVASCTVPTATIVNYVNTLCRGKNRCAVPTSQAFWGTLATLSSCAGNAATAFIANYTCANNYAGRCFLYDTFCNPFDYSTMATGGMIKWNGPWIRSSDNSTALVTTAIYACQGIVNPDSECITMRSRPPNQVSTLTNTFCAGNLTGVTYSYTVTSNQTNANFTVIITVDGVVVVRNDTIRSKAYTNDTAVNRISVRMPTTYYLPVGNHTVVISIVSNVSLTSAIFLRDFGIASSNTDANCNTTCAAAIYPSQSQPQSKSVRPATKSARPQTKSVRPQTKSVRPQTKSVRPQTKSARPQTKSVRPQSKSAIPQSKSPNPQTKSAIPQTKSAVPQSKSNISNSKSPKPQSKSVIPQSKSNAQSKSAKPQSKSPKKTKSHSQSMSTSMSNTHSRSNTNSMSNSMTQINSAKPQSTSPKKTKSNSQSMSESTSNTKSWSNTDSMSNSMSPIKSATPQTISPKKTKSYSQSTSASISNSKSISSSMSESWSDTNSESMSDSSSRSSTNSALQTQPPIIYTETQTSVAQTQSMYATSESQTNTADPPMVSVSPVVEYNYCNSFARRRQRRRR